MGRPTQNREQIALCGSRDKDEVRASAVGSKLCSVPHVHQQAGVYTGEVYGTHDHTRTRTQFEHECTKVTVHIHCQSVYLHEP